MQSSVAKVSWKPANVLCPKIWPQMLQYYQSVEWIHIWIEKCALFFRPVVWQSLLLRGLSAHIFFMCIYAHALATASMFNSSNKDFSASYPSILCSPESSCCKSTLTWTFDLWGWEAFSSVHLTEGRRPCQWGVKTINNTNGIVIEPSQPLF